MSFTIEFKAVPPFGDENGNCLITKPYPAEVILPDWCRQLSGVLQQGDLQPLTDSLAQGYIIPAPFDLIIDRQRDPDTNEWVFLDRVRVPEGIDAEQMEMWMPFADGHVNDQFPGAPWENATTLKFQGYWYIRTPPGYSTLFTAPQGRNSIDLPFDALPGLVEGPASRDPAPTPPSPSPSTPPPAAKSPSPTRPPMPPPLPPPTTPPPPLRHSPSPPAARPPPSRSHSPTTISSNPSKLSPSTPSPLPPTP